MLLSGQKDKKITQQLSVFGIAVAVVVV